MEKTEQFSFQEQSSVAEMPIEYSEKTGDELLDMNLNEYQFNEECRLQKEDSTGLIQDSGMDD
jgi:hypothetical protein